MRETILTSLLEIAAGFAVAHPVGLVFIVGSVVFGFLLKRPGFKGWLGEQQVNLAAKLLLDKAVYHLIPNVTIPDDRGGTTQIDHIIVSIYGIFVVETKNLTGWIFGGQGDRQWTQKIHKNHSQKFQNPLHQNYKHTKTLASLLGLPEEKLKSLVVFVGNSVFKSKSVPENVTYCGGYIQFIKKHQELVFTDDEVQAILANIAEQRLAPGWQTHRQHAANVRTIKEAQPETPEVESEPAATIDPAAASAVATTVATCPKCGAELKRRTAKRGPNAGGSFWGCSAYPHCRYMQADPHLSA